MNRNFSIYLDLLRVLAALTVVIDHMIMLTPASFLWHLRPLGHEAVIVFFVLSGFVISYAVEVKDRDLSTFTISRLARLYSVLLPCLIVTPLLNLVGSHVNPGAYVYHYTGQTSLSAIIQNGLFLNQIWFGNVAYFHNGPLWSLSYEFWYYVIFGLAFFLRGRARTIAVLAACLIAGPKILLLMPIWLMGAAAYRLTKCYLPTWLSALLTFGSALAIFAYFRLHLDVGLNQLSAAAIGSTHLDAYHFSRFFIADTALGLMVTAHFIGAAGIAHHMRFGAATAFIRSAAGFTFSIYLFHLPLLYFGNALLPHGLSANWRATAIFTLAAGGSCLMGLVTERKKYLYVRALSAIRARWLPAVKPARETA